MLTALELPGLNLIRKMENDFFKSLNHLAALYRFQPLRVKDRVFPYNIQLAHAHAEKEVKRSEKNIALIILNEEDDCTLTLATVKTLETGSTLYYIAIEPLVRLLRQKETRETAGLLMAVFAYLYQVVKMPFCDRSSYLGGSYLMMAEWLEEQPGEWEPDDYRQKLAQVRSIFRYGRIIEEHIRRPVHLQQFGQRIKQFKPVSEVERALLKTARVFYRLFQAYPGCSFFDNLADAPMDNDGDGQIYVEQYFSFFWTTKGWLYEDLIENVNINLQEMSDIDEPQALQFFDKPQHKLEHNLDFETRLLNAVSDLADVLNNF